MSKPTRLDPGYDEGGFYGMEESLDGDYVFWSDYQKALDLIKKLNAATGWHGRQYRAECGKFLNELGK